MINLVSVGRGKSQFRGQTEFEVIIISHIYHYLKLDLYNM